jgi:hypothetical protein
MAFPVSSFLYYQFLGKLTCNKGPNKKRVECSVALIPVEFAHRYYTQHFCVQTALKKCYYGTQ